MHHQKGLKGQMRGGAQRAHGMKHPCHWEHGASDLSGDAAVRTTEEGRRTPTTINSATENSLW